MVEIEPLNVVPAGNAKFSWDDWAESVKVGIEVAEAERVAIAANKNRLATIGARFLTFCIAYEVNYEIINDLDENTTNYRCFPNYSIGVCTSR